MRQWEYEKLDLNAVSDKSSDVDLLRAAGSQGWEVVQIMPNHMAYVKREIVQGPAPKRRAVKT